MSPTLRFPDSVPELVGQAVFLRELTEADVGAWFERATDAEAAELAGDPIPDSIEKGAAWLERHRDRFRRQAGIRWAIVPCGAVESVGTVGLTITSTKDCVAGLGIVVGRAFWGKGIGTAAVRLVTGYAFESLGLVEIRAEVLPRNVASRRVLEKTGFKRRAAAAEPTAGDDSDCCMYVLRSSDDSAVAQRSQ